MKSLHTSVRVDDHGMGGGASGAWTSALPAMAVDTHAAASPNVTAARVSLDRIRISGHCDTALVNKGATLTG